MPDFIPRDNDELITWATNLINRIDAHASTLLWTAAQVTAFKAVLQHVIDTAVSVKAARTALASAVANMKTVKETDLAKSGPIRVAINQWKTSGLLTTAMAEDMDVVGTGDVFDAATYKAKIKATVFAGYVRITYQKHGVDGLNLYVRLKGQTTWRKLTYDTNSPYDDYTELAVPGTPEVREYRAIGVIDHQEVCQPSDIVSVTFGG